VAEAAKKRAPVADAKAKKAGDSAKVPRDAVAPSRARSKSAKPQSPVAPAAPPARSKSPSAKRAPKSSASALSAVLAGLLFKPSLTVAGADPAWSDLGDGSFQATRCALVHALIGTTSLDLFGGPKAALATPLAGFPHALFIESVSRVSAAFLAGDRADAVTASLLRNSFIFAARQFSSADFRAAFAEVSAWTLLKAFAQSPQAVPIFDPYSAVAGEALSFFYIAILFQPALVTTIAENGYSNGFVQNLVFAAELTFESVGFCYLHTILLSAILRIVANPIAAEKLNEGFDGEFACTFQPTKGSFADTLLSVCLHFSGREAWPSVACILHTIAPFVTAVAPQTAKGLIKFFAQAAEEEGLVAVLIAEAFAAVVQRRGRKSALLLEIARAGQLFQAKSGTADPKLARALAVVLRFVEAVAGVQGKKIAAAVKAVDPEQVFPEIQAFTRRPHIVGKEMERTWREWSRTLFARAFDWELHQLKVAKDQPAGS
jgi:hypothetical protein